MTQGRAGLDIDRALTSTEPATRAAELVLGGGLFGTFAEFVEELKRTKDREEFDAFMARRRSAQPGT